MSRYVAAVVALLALVLSYFAKSTGLVALLIVVCVLATLWSLLAFVESRVSSAARSQVYLPTPEERVVLEKRNERLRQEHAQRREQGQRLEPPPTAGPKPPAP